MMAAERLTQVQKHLAPSIDPSRLDGQVVLITGGAQGIGKAAAELLASKGAKIAINDLDEGKARHAAEELIAAGYDAFHMAGDLLEKELPQKLVDAVIQRFGKLNVVVNGAGFLVDSPVHKMSEEQFDIVMKIHNYVPFRMFKAVASHWMNKENITMPKAVINIASVSGLHGSQGQINYSTAKAGVLGMTRAMAREWSRFNVRCNAVAYGWIDTRMTRPPDGNDQFVSGGQHIKAGIPREYKKWRDTSDILVEQRAGTAQEAANVILFLASPMAAYMTGACVECTGGRYL